VKTEPTASTEPNTISCSFRPWAPTVFIHIPKTAGSSLRSILARQFPRPILTVREWRLTDRPYRADETLQKLRGYASLPDEKKVRYRLIQGHLHFGLQEFLPQDANYFSVLRDPVKRIVSMYSYALRECGNFLHTAVSEKKMSLLDFASSDLTLELENDQSRRLGGVFAESDLQWGQPWRHMFERAAKSIRENFFLVGLTERFDETVLLLKRIAAWRTPYYERQNVSPANDDVPAEVINIIEERNRADIELYTYTQRVLAAAVAEHGAQFQRELKIFRFWNRYISMCYRVRNGVRQSLRLGTAAASSLASSTRLFSATRKRSNGGE
jgi:hypothetical protein